MHFALLVPGLMFSQWNTMSPATHSLYSTKYYDQL